MAQLQFPIRSPFAELAGRFAVGAGPGLGAHLEHVLPQRWVLQLVDVGINIEALCPNPMQGLGCERLHRLAVGAGGAPGHAALLVAG